MTVIFIRLYHQVLNVYTFNDVADLEVIFNDVGIYHRSSIFFSYRSGAARSKDLVNGLPSYVERSAVSLYT
ncbi:hypothetical protein DSUL_20527 [Desulfovibrionales bacterium]